MEPDIPLQVAASFIKSRSITVAYVVDADLQSPALGLAIVLEEIKSNLAI